LIGKLGGAKQTPARSGEEWGHTQCVQGVTKVLSSIYRHGYYT